MPEPCARQKAFQDPHVKRLPIFVSALPHPECDDYHTALCGPSRSTMLLSLLVSKGKCFWFHSRRYLFVSAVPQEARSRYDVVLAQRSRFVVHSNVSPLSPFNPFWFIFFFSPSYAWAYFCFGNWLMILVKHWNPLPVCQSRLSRSTVPYPRSKPREYSARLWDWSRRVLSAY